MNGIAEHQPDEMISLPYGHPLVDNLKQELSSFKMVDDNSSGKMAIESKKALKKRGINSPNLAEALAMVTAKRPRLGFTKKASGERIDNRTTSTSTISGGDPQW